MRADVSVSNLRKKSLKPVQVKYLIDLTEILFLSRILFVISKLTFAATTIENYTGL